MQARQDGRPHGGVRGLASLKRFTLNYVSFFLLLALTSDALVANWTINPIWDFLYARIQLNLFYNVHASSVLFVCISAFYLAFYKKDGLAPAVFSAFGIAALHELIIDFNDWVFWGVPSGITWPYFSYLSAFLVIGSAVNKRYHKRVWLVASLGLFAWFVFLGQTHTFIGSTIDPNVPFGASPYFYNPITNLAEVGSWIAPVSLWFLPRRWFEWNRRLP